MAENKEKQNYGYAEESENSLFNLQFLWSTFLLNWKWFILSLLICLGCALVYLRYATPTYTVSAKLLVKDNDSKYSRSRSNGLESMANLGILSNSDGFDNEIEVLASRSIAKDAVQDLKLYTNYFNVGTIKDRMMYKNQYVNVDLDAVHLENLLAPVEVVIEKVSSKKYDIEVTFLADKDDETRSVIKKSVDAFPALIHTKVGLITMTANATDFRYFQDGKKQKAIICNPDKMAAVYARALSVAPTSKTTTIALLSIIDASTQRGIDYLKQVAEVYNRQANEDKNEIAYRTEQFINDRLQKIDAELGNTDGAIESYKRSNNVVDIKASAQQRMTSTSAYEQQLVEAETQLLLLNSISDYINQPRNQYQTLPSNVGLKDAAATSLISQYNAIVLERNRMLRSASEKSPAVQTLTAQLDDLTTSIRDAITQTRKDQEILRNSIAKQYSKYTGQVSQAPEQERFLTQIGRQQEVKSSLYIMLLQKREENSISLAATANKGKLIDEPSDGGLVKPKKSMVLAIALLLAFAIPFCVFFLIELLRYRIEGHDDVARLTKLPIIADVAVASDTAKSKADIVVHENQNNQMEEIFRAMRTNLQFTMKENEKVVMFTSSTSGEGKSFCASNLAVSFALLGKKVLLVGLDIRRPRLNTLFELNDKKHGITNILVHDNITSQLVREQIVASGVNPNLELLMAGPIPPNPAELIARKSLDDIFAILRDEYDFIVVDTAPVGLVTDTLGVGRVVDATIYTCRADYTSRAAFANVNTLSEEKKLPNISIVINGIDMSKKKYGYYYGNERYGKYGKYGSYGKSYGGYNSYGYGNYVNSHYGDANDNSLKK